MACVEFGCLTLSQSSLLFLAFLHLLGSLNGDDALNPGLGGRSRSSPSDLPPFLLTFGENGKDGDVLSALFLQALELLGQFSKFQGHSLFSSTTLNKSSSSSFLELTH